MLANGDLKAKVLNRALCYVAFDYRKHFYVCNTLNLYRQYVKRIEENLKERRE